MSSSSRLFGDSDNSRVDLPVFITPYELVFSVSKRRTILVLYNPYGNDAQFKIMTTNPERFDVSQTKGTIKPNRRIDITIRLLTNKISELPEPTDELQLIDHFRISIQVASLRGNRQIKVYWIASVDYSDNEDDNTGKSAKLKRALMKQTGASSAFTSATSQRGGLINSSSSSGSHLLGQQQGPTPLLAARSSSARLARSQMQDHHAVGHHTGSNVNLVCFLGAIVCVMLLFLPLAIDSELCKKAKLYADPDELGDHPSAQSFLSRLSNFLSVSYEMKFGCSFALGLFTYRLISTMPD